MRKTEQIMGLPITVDISACDQPEVFEQVFSRLREIDQKFSTYKNDSEVCRLNRGEIKKPGADLAEVIAACRKFEKLTDGFFSAWASGEFEPSGYVKGWAISEAGKIIRRGGFGTFGIYAGGDILVASDSDKIWGIAVQDPADRKNIIKILELKNGAVATSGNYERGVHIINPKTGKLADYWASVTVVGPEIITADVLATACFAAGPEAEEIVKNFPAYELIPIK